MTWRDPNYRYYPADESRKPGYLKRRFDAIRKRQAELEREAKEKTIVMPRAAAAKGK